MGFFSSKQSRQEKSWLIQVQQQKQQQLVGVNLTIAYVKAVLRIWNAKWCKCVNLKLAQINC